MATEKPQYTIIKQDGSFELREYAPSITAVVNVAGRDYREAAYRGFSPLAGYIFGKNTGKQEISMTSPVTAQPQPEKIAMTSPVTITKGQTYRVEFFMPSQYTLENLPKPADERVTFSQNPARRAATVRFSGTFSQRNFERQIKRLQVWMQTNGLEQDGEPVIAGYNPPFTPWFLKHNEILIDIKS